MRGLSYWEKCAEDSIWLKQNLKELRFEIKPVLLRQYDERVHIWIQRGESEWEFDVKFPLGFVARVESIANSVILGTPWDFNFWMFRCSKLLVQYSPCPKWNRQTNQHRYIHLLGMERKEQVMDFCARLRNALAEREQELEKCIVTFALCLRQWDTPRDIRKMIVRRAYAQIRKDVLESIA